MDYIKRLVKGKLAPRMPDSAKEMMKRKVFEKYFFKNEKSNPTAEEVCGNIWYNGSDDQREIFGGGTEGKTTDEQPPEEWWDDCIDQKSEELEAQT